MAQVNTDDGLLTQGFFKTKFWGKLLGMLANNLNTSNKNLAADYDPTATYVVGDYCIYHNELYVCTTDISVAEEWNGSHWQRTTVSDIVGDVESLLAAL